MEAQTVRMLLDNILVNIRIQTNGDIEKHLWEEHTRYAKHQKCVEDVSDSLFVRYV